MDDRQYPDDLSPFHQELEKSLESLGVRKAISFHRNNNYEGKIANISLGGINCALNKALQENLGFTLTERELSEVHKQIRSIRKSKKIGF